ncbi:MAG: hypothetical protein AB1726_14310 [Planctomycetota bacterium]
MPRPACDLIAGHVLPWAEMDWPLPWDALFGRAAPLALEIGFGGGEFLAAQALSRPERNHVGVERSWTSVAHLLRKIERQGLVNVRILLAEAEAALAQLFAPASLVEVFMNHPCPWPKTRHGARRLVRPEVVALLADRMAEGARLTLVTDHAGYAAEAAAVLEGQDALVSCHATTETAAIPGRRPTRYQEKAMARDVPIHFFEWQKVRPPRSLAPLPSSDPLHAMPSLTLRARSPIPPERESLLAGFAPAIHRAILRRVETVVRFSGAYAGLDGTSWLVETLVVEGRLRQEFAVLVLRAAAGEVLVRLSALGRPHPTPGVKRAVWEVGRWLRARHPELELAHENLGRQITGLAAGDGAADGE